MPFRKLILFALLMPWTISGWATTPGSFIYTIQHGGTHSILIDFGRLGTRTDESGVTTTAGTYYADYLSGPLMNVGLQESNYAYNGSPYPEGYPGILVVGNDLVFESYPMENCLYPFEICPRSVVYPVELWKAGTELCIASTCESGPNALITQKMSTVPLVNGWVLFVSGLMTLYYAGARKRSARSRC